MEKAAQAALALLAGGCGAGPPDRGPSDRVVPVSEEPRHQPVGRTGWAEILDVRFPPGDTTLYHTHTRPIGYVCIDGSTLMLQVRGESWGEPVDVCEAPGTAWSDLAYVDRPLTHRVANVGTAPFRLIAIQSLVDEVEFVPAQVDLHPGDVTPPHTHGAPTLVILVAGGSAAIRRLDADEQSSEETVLLDPGAWTWISPGLVHVLADGRDGDAVPVRVVEIELRGAEEARASARGRPRPSGSQTGPGSPRDPS